VRGDRERKDKIFRLVINEPAVVCSCKAELGMNNLQFGSTNGFSLCGLNAKNSGD
jgi:hypothetical protein